MLDSWGGATIAYRRRLIDSPSYTLNHEEVAKAMEEAMRFAEGLTSKSPSETSTVTVMLRALRVKTGR